MCSPDDSRNRLNDRVLSILLWCRSKQRHVRGRLLLDCQHHPGMVPCDSLPGQRSVRTGVHETYASLWNVGGETEASSRPWIRRTRSQARDARRHLKARSVNAGVGCTDGMTSHWSVKEARLFISVRMKGRMPAQGKIAVGGNGSVSTKCQKWCSNCYDETSA